MVAPPFTAALVLTSYPLGRGEGGVGGGMRRALAGLLQVGWEICFCLTFRGSDPLLDFVT